MTPSRRPAGHYSGDAELVVGDQRAAVLAEARAWIEVLEGGIDGLSDWVGSMRGSGSPPDLVGGPHMLCLPDGQSGQILVTNLSANTQGGWTALFQGSGPCPF